jgi:NAD(P)-dependent dehydrogenase (short-subunit alcohol dehydrogenase family)
VELHTGDVAVITGGGSGIGFALAERFARAGLQIVVADVDQSALDDAVARLQVHGTEILGVRTDVSKEAEVDALAEATLDRFGAVHVVCNNAGVSSRSDPWLGPIEAWTWVFGVNLWGVLYGVRAFLPHLVAAGRGHVVNTASMAGLVPGVGAPYDASKHAVVALTEDLSLNLIAARMPVGVSLLCPGWVRTQIVDADRNWPEEHGAPPPRSVTTGAIEHHIRRAVAEGMTPAAVADLVAVAVEEGRFWVLPQDDWLEMATDRWGRISERLDPVMPTQIPGMPPSEQLFTEMIEAALRDDPLA